MFYKVVHGILPIDKLTPASSRTRSKHKLKFKQYSPSTDSFKYSFFPRTIPTWNNLSAKAAEAPYLVAFKQELPTWNMGPIAEVIVRIARAVPFGSGAH